MGGAGDGGRFWDLARWVKIVDQMSDRAIGRTLSEINLKNLPKSFPEASPDYSEIVYRPPRDRQTDRTYKDLKGK